VKILLFIISTILVLAYVIRSIRSHRRHKKFRDKISKENKDKNPN